MDRVAELPARTNVLQRIILIALMIGVFGSLTISLLRGADSAQFIQVGAAITFVVYIVTFIDLTLGLAILIPCVGLSPEFSLAGVNDVRFEDFVVPALLLSWLSRAMKNREPLA